VRVLSVALALPLAAALAMPTAAAAALGDITEFSTGLNVGSHPVGMAPGSDGNVWFADDGTTKAIGRISPSGQITEFSTGLNAGARPLGIAFGPDGNVWFTDHSTTNPAIGRVTPSGQITEFSTGLNPGSFPVGIAPGPDGNVWFGDRGTTPGIGQVTPTGRITEFSTGLNLGSSPNFIAPGSDGNLWFTDTGTTKAIGRITPSGHIDEFSGGLTFPAFIAAGADGSLWFTDGSAIGRINPTTQAVMHFSTGLNPSPHLTDLAAGPDGNIWFGDEGTTRAIGRITPSGQITEFSTGLNAGAFPAATAAGADGNVWFSDEAVGAAALGRVTTGAPAAQLSPPTLSGAGQQGASESCQGHLASWAGIGPSTSLYAFDGYGWLRDGTPIPGQTGPSYAPTPADVGHQLACRITTTYPLPFFVTVSSTSAAITVQAPVPALSSLRISPRKFSLAGRKVDGRCVAPTHKNANDKPCRRAVRLRVSYTLNVAAKVTFTIQRKVGRKFVRLRGKLSFGGKAGANHFIFKGKIGGRRLGPGIYQLTATPSGGTPHKKTFKLA
jgi:virginiamycin B lyase